MKKKPWIVAGGIIALALAAFIIYYVAFRGSSSNEDVVYVSSVNELMGVGSGNGLESRFAGVVESQESWKVEQNQDRTVKEILVKAGDEVKKGDVLLTYDTGQAESDLAEAQLELEKLQNDISNSQSNIEELEKEKKTVGEDQQLQYTMEIQSAQTEIKRNQYDIKSKQESIKKLKTATKQTQVKSKIDGVIQSVNNSDSSDMSYSASGDSTALITVMQVGNYRVKGTVNEQNAQSIVAGNSAIIRSRVDGDLTWKGTMGSVDRESPNSSNASSDMYYGDGSTDTAATSSSYPFYVELESSDGLMLGQHVYIEMDVGQDNAEEGVWLEDYYINDMDTDPYVWAADGKGKLEKRAVTLGKHNDEQMKSEIISGLTGEDLITFPDPQLTEGLDTEVSDTGQLGMQNSGDSTDSMSGMDSTDSTDSGTLDEPMQDDSTEEIPAQEIDPAAGGPENAEVIDEDTGSVTDDMSSQGPGDTEEAQP